MSRKRQVKEKFYAQQLDCNAICKDKFEPGNYLVELEDYGSHIRFARYPEQPDSAQPEYVLRSDELGAVTEICEDAKVMRRSRTQFNKVAKAAEKE